MVKQCKCGNNICCLDKNDEVECTTCGCIFVDDKNLKQIGLTEYKFPDINYVYTHVFADENELLDFMSYVKKNKSEYEYCKIFTPIKDGMEEMILVQNGNFLL